MFCWHIYGSSAKGYVYCYITVAPPKKPSGNIDGIVSSQMFIKFAFLLSYVARQSVMDCL